MIKAMIKCYLLKYKKNIQCKNSIVNFNIQSKSKHLPSLIENSKVHIEEIGDGCRLENIITYGRIKIGRFVSISGPGTVLHAENNYIEIGDFCSIAQNVTIQEFNHCMNYPTTSAIKYLLNKTDFSLETISKGPVIIEEDVWIGANTVILSGITIGRGAIIGAGSIVTKSVPAYSIVCGNPAKVLRMRFSPQTIDKLEKLKWWQWSLDDLRRNTDFFSMDLNRSEDWKYLHQGDIKND